MREHVQYKVKTDVKEERRKEGNLPDIELHQLHGHALAETFHGELRGSVNIIEHHSCTENGGKKRTSVLCIIKEFIHSRHESSIIYT